MRFVWWAGLAVALCGCRADVEGTWTGEIGGEEARLSLEQKGSAIDGEVCIGKRCDTIDDGVLEERSLILTYGCSGCTLERATLDLELRGDLEGEKHLWNCDCDVDDDDCGCREQAHFGRGARR